MSAALETAIYAKLAADTGAGGAYTLTTGRLYNTVAPSTATTPYLVFAKVDGTIEHNIGSRVSRGYRYQFTAVAQGASRATIEALLARVVALFSRVSLSVSGETFWVGEWVSDGPAEADDVNGTLWQWGSCDCRFILGG